MFFKKIIVLQVLEIVVTVHSISILLLLFLLLLERQLKLHSYNKDIFNYTTINNILKLTIMTDVQICDLCSTIVCYMNHDFSMNDVKEHLDKIGVNDTIRECVIELLENSMC